MIDIGLEAITQCLHHIQSIVFYSYLPEKLTLPIKWGGHHSLFRYVTAPGGSANAAICSVHALYGK